MKFSVLGCSGGIGGSLRTTSYRVDNDILLDCGTGVGDLSLESLESIRHIFVTHAHLDHVCMLPLLVDSIFDSLQQNPVTLYASQAVLDVLNEHLFNWQIWPDFFTLPNEDNPVLIAKALEVGDSVSLGDRTITPLPVEHTVPAQGYLIASGTGKSLAFSGDTGPNEELWRALNALPALDHLLVECAYPEQERDLAALARHYTPGSLTEELDRLTHKPQVAIVHLKPGGEALIMDQLGAMAPERTFRVLQSGDEISL